MRDAREALKGAAVKSLDQRQRATRNAQMASYTSLHTLDAERRRDHLSKYVIHKHIYLSCGENKK